jgi:hypothetical protein
MSQRMTCWLTNTLSGYIKRLKRRILLYITRVLNLLFYKNFLKKAETTQIPTFHTGYTRRRVGGSLVSFERLDRSTAEPIDGISSLRRRPCHGVLERGSQPSGTAPRRPNDPWAPRAPPAFHRRTRVRARGQGRSRAKGNQSIPCSGKASRVILPTPFSEATP